MWVVGDWLDSLPGRTRSDRDLQLKDAVMKRMKEVPEELPEIFFRNALSTGHSRNVFHAVTKTPVSLDDDQRQNIMTSFLRIVANSINIRLFPSITFKENDSFILKTLFGNNEFIENLSKDKSYYSIVLKLNMLWQLLQQDEFLFSSVLSKHSKSFPAVLGFCGPHYLVQKCVNFNELKSFATTSSRRSRSLHLEAAISILNLIDDLQTSFSETLNVCDMKLSNFGFHSLESLSDHSNAVPRRVNAVLIDADSVAFDSQLTGIFQPPRENLVKILNYSSFGWQFDTCTGDNECSFFDCLGSCDLLTHRCSLNRRDTNVAAFCRKILKSPISYQSFYASVLAFIFGQGYDGIDDSGIVDASDFSVKSKWKEYSAVLRDCLSSIWWGDCVKNVNLKECSTMMIERLQSALVDVE